MNSLVISYRRDNASAWAGRLSRDLAKAFGDVARFFELAFILPVVDFMVATQKVLEDAATVLVLMRLRWLEMRGKQGPRWLDDPGDVIAHEIAQALVLPIPVIPVLPDGEAMPSSSALPERPPRLARRKPIELSEVSVGRRLRMRDSEAGDVTGVRGASHSGAIDVLRGATLTSTKLADVTRIDASLSPTGATK